MKSLQTILKLLAFILLTTLNVEYLINQQSNTLLFVLAIAIEIGLIYFFIIPLIKKLLK